MASVNITFPSSTNQSDAETNAGKTEYNQRWFGYLCVAFFSSINFACISNVEPLDDAQFGNMIGVAFGVLTFIIASLVLIQDRSRKLLDYFHYTKLKNGYVEGSVLLFMVVWWSVGVGIVTTPGGIAYQASNIYYSSWGTLFSCLYTLNLWSTEKEILSVAEITGVSCTLKSWWAHFLSGCVVFVCGMNFNPRTYVAQYSSDADTPYVITLGLVSIVLSIFWIGVHLNFFSMWRIQEGGWLELLSSFFLIFVWVVGVGVFTSDGGIAAKMEGDECKSDLYDSVHEGDCSVKIFIQDSKGVVKNYQLECEELPEEVPGSNLYYSCWACMLSSIAIAFKWKASQALKFAQAQAELRRRHDRSTGEGVLSDDENDNGSKS